jgi:ABC-type hemin transport system ATPase subunit
VSGATVYGVWSGAYSGERSGVTDENGKATLTSGLTKGSELTFVFTVTDVVRTGWVYDEGANVETERSITTP